MRTAALYELAPLPYLTDLLQSWPPAGSTLDDPRLLERWPLMRLPDPLGGSDAYPAPSTGQAEQSLPTRYITAVPLNGDHDGAVVGILRRPHL